MDKSKVYLIDLDGTVYKGNEALPYAKEFFEFLDANRIKYYILTNCPSNSDISVENKLKKMGLSVPCEKIITSGAVSTKIIAEKFPKCKVYCVGSSALKDEVVKCGLTLSEQNADCVLIGFDESINYSELKVATREVINGAKLFCTNADAVIPGECGSLPHTGAIAKIVEFAANVSGEYIGKPQKYMFEEIRKIESDARKFVMIGDGLMTDIKFANNCGIESYLVLTGTTSRKDCDNTDLKITKIYDSLKSIIEEE